MLYIILIYIGGGNSNILYVHPFLGENDPIRRAYFSIGLVQPPTSYISHDFEHVGYNLWF